MQWKIEGLSERIGPLMAAGIAIGSIIPFITDPNDVPALLLGAVLGALFGILLAIVIPSQFEPAQGGVIATKEVEKTSSDMHTTLFNTRSMSTESWVLVGVIALFTAGLFVMAMIGISTPHGTPGSAFPPTINGQ